VSGPHADEEDESNDDIEASIKKEVASMGDQQGKPKLFSPVHLDLECVMFFKTRSPIDPVDFVHRICKEAASKPDIRRMRYVNRLTPVSVIGKATEKGIAEVGEAVLGAYFQLSGKKEGEEDAENTGTPYSVSTLWFIIRNIYAATPLPGNRRSLSREESFTNILLGNY
jgi:tRNA acetyltransferase TAN1